MANHKNVILLFLFLFCSNGIFAQLKIGDTLRNIKLPDSLGHLQELNQFKNKLVILDFWASWCSPCRRYSSPFLVEMYNKYHSQGLEIYAVSFDKDYYSWVHAVQKDKFPFMNVNDVYSWNGKAAKAYNVTSMPAKFLCYNGKIVLTETAAMVEIENKIKEILGSNSQYKH